jgi:Tfp pilus assembly protein PilX
MCTPQYLNQVVKENATTTAGTENVAFDGLGKFNHLALRLEVGGVSGGSDALDVKLQTQFTGTKGSGSGVWTDVITMTQATGATTETKYEVKDGSTGWGDKCRVVIVTATGATATGVYINVIGSNA